MPLPQGLARFNRRVTNPIARTFIARLPGGGILVHRGRHTGREYRTPVAHFGRFGGGVTIALTYGPRTEWVQNVLAAGGCRLEARGRTLELANPRLLRDHGMGLVPAPVGAVLRFLHADWFLLLDRAGAGPSP